MADKKVRNPIEKARVIYDKKEGGGALNALSLLMSTPKAYDRRFKTPIYFDRLPKDVAGRTRYVGEGMEALTPSRSTIDMPKKQRFDGLDSYMSEYGKPLKHELIHVLQNLMPDASRKMASLIDEDPKSWAKNRIKDSGLPNDKESMAYLINRDLGFNDDTARVTEVRKPDRQLDSFLNRTLEKIAPSPKRSFEALRSEMLGRAPAGMRKYLESITSPADLSWGENSRIPE